MKIPSSSLKSSAIPISEVATRGGKVQYIATAVIIDENTSPFTLKDPKELTGSAVSPKEREHPLKALSMQHEEKKSGVL